MIIVGIWPDRVMSCCKLKCVDAFVKTGVSLSERRCCSHLAMCCSLAATYLSPFLRCSEHSVNANLVDCKLSERLKMFQDHENDVLCTAKK